MGSEFERKVNEYKERQVEAKSYIKRSLKGKKKTLLVIIPSLILLFGLISVIFIVKGNEKVYNEQRYTGLDYYEQTKSMVLGNIVQYFYINSTETWSKARTDMNVKSEEKVHIFGTSYSESRYANFEKIKVLDISYTVKDTGKITYYMLLDCIDARGVNYTTNILVDVEEGKIIKIEGF